MRATKVNGGLKVHAVAGTYVVTLGFDMPEDQCSGLLGFSVHRQDQDENEAYYLEGMKCFAETDPGFEAGALYPTDEQPVQSFQWADYTAKPGHQYTYTVAALNGTPQQLKPFVQTSVKVRTESPLGGTHDVYFNSGVAGSQAYVRRFGDKSPNNIPNNKAFEWLSRGLYEAMTDFVRQATPQRHALRIAAYEFHYRPFLKVLKQLLNNGVDLKIVYDGRKDKPRTANRKAVTGEKLKSACSERNEGSSYISHNKFIVLLEDGEPKCIWTGGTNFSEGGIFGHSNVAHVVEDKKVAKKYSNTGKSWPPIRQWRP